MHITQHEFNSAISLYKEGRYLESLNVTQVALVENPNDGKLWELCGMTQSAMGNTAASIHALETANTLVPLSAGAQCVLAKCYAASGHRNLAREMYRHLASLETLPENLLAVVAAGLGSVGEFALALEACRRAASRAIDSGQPLYGMAHYMGRLGYPLEMIASVLRKAVDLEPNHVHYRVALVDGGNK